MGQQKESTKFMFAHKLVPHHPNHWAF